MAIQIFDDHEGMWNSIGQKNWDDNMAAGTQLRQRYKEAQLEYKEKSGFNERFLKQQEELKRQGKIDYTFNPAHVQLSEEDQKKFVGENPDLGNGLELTALVQLYSVGDGYSFGATSVQTIGMDYSPDTNYDSLSDLVIGIRSKMVDLNKSHFNATVEPHFYITREDSPLVPEHISQDVDAFLAEIEEEAAKDEDLPEDLKNELFGEIRELFSNTDRMRGLNKEECEEFERLYG